MERILLWKANVLILLYQSSSANSTSSQEPTGMVTERCSGILTQNNNNIFKGMHTKQVILPSP